MFNEMLVVINNKYLLETKGEGYKKYTTDIDKALIFTSRGEAQAVISETDDNKGSIINRY